MPYTDTPLRYPGGKTQFTPFVRELLRENDLFYGHYVEPFAGGAGVAWRLLLNGYVTHIHINDIDPAIHAFWHCALYRTEELCERIERCKVTVPAWRRHRARLRRRTSPLETAFSAFFINRTSRSGIMDGGVIGGFAQTGDYTVDCRFNKSELIRKIERIGAHRRQVTLTRMDALAFLKKAKLPQDTLINLDPPYYKRGRELYENHYAHEDHRALSVAVRKLKRRWMVTYDDHPETRAFYDGVPRYGNALFYSANEKRIGIELLVLDPRLRPPLELRGCRV